MIFEQFKSTADQIKDKVKASGDEVFAKVAGAGRQGLAKAVKKLFEEYSNIAPILESAGFIVGDVELRLTLPPAIVVCIEPTEPDALDRLNKVVSEMDLNDNQKSVLQLIKEAYALEDTVKAHGHEIGQIELVFSVPPGVNVHLSSSRSRVFGSVDQASSSSDVD
ncbi:MAG: mitochondrial small ribosomal subunit protein uS9m [Gammaproteobacteria bacterium]|nr:mitochondrial small ribosomal subunit protein uS9m [Gammaproteobacteria bacterium]